MLIKLFNKYSALLVIVFATVFYYLPILLNPAILLNRNNDLQEQFWPNFYFIREQLLQNHSLPLWNNTILSGTPLLPDPQSGLFYPLNIFFLILPINIAFIISFIVHTFLAGVGMYLLAKIAFNFSKITRLFMVISYIFTPKLAGYLVAGHYTLITSLTWTPFVLLALIMIIKKPTINWSLALAFALAGSFYTNTIIFAITLVLIPIIFITELVLRHQEKIKSICFLTLSIILTFGLSTISLLPQIDWSSQTTRFLLLQTREVFPIWTSSKEILINIFSPWFKGYANIWSIDAEKWIPLGILLTSLAIVGFIKLERKLKILSLLLIVTTLLITANNSSPLHRLLISQDWFVLMRVSSRVWFIPNLITIILAGFGVEFLIKKGVRFLYLILALCILELIFLSWVRLQTPVSSEQPFAPPALYEFVKNNLGDSRVFCINRCISQKQATILNLQLIEGYNPLIQKNYNEEAWQLTGGYWKTYSHTIPAIGTYTFEKLQPDSVSLGQYNTKYVISKHPLLNKDFMLAEQIDEYLIYQNMLLKPRARYPQNTQKAEIIRYSPNRIAVNVESHQSNQLILSEVYSKGWRAYLNGKKEIPVQERPDRLRLVDLQPDTKFVVFEYKPLSYEIGKWVSLATIILCFLLSQFNKRSLKASPKAELSGSAYKQFKKI